VGATRADRLRHLRARSGVADYHLNFGGLVDVDALKRLFNIAREDGLASWFQTTQTLMAAITLWLLYGITRAQARDEARWISRGWLVLAWLFTYMVVDDGAQGKPSRCWRFRFCGACLIAHLAVVAAELCIRSVYHY